MNFENKVVVVTGGAGGVGREIVRKLLKRSACVAALDVNESALEKLKEEMHSDSLGIYKTDISDENQVIQTARTIFEDFKAVHVLINNAGIVQPFLPFEELSEEVVRRVLNINTFGTVNMIRAFLPYLKKESRSSLANVSSMGGFVSIPGQTVYGASKAAIKILTEGLKLELQNTSVRISEVFPGGLDTQITTNSGVKPPHLVGGDFLKKYVFKLTSPEKAAETILRGIEKEKPRILVGRDAKFMDFLSRLNPLFASRFIYTMMNRFMEV